MKPNFSTIKKNVRKLWCKCTLRYLKSCTLLEADQASLLTAKMKLFVTIAYD